MTVGGWWRRVDRARGGLWVDLGLYGLSALFAWYTAVGSTLPPHRAWGSLAVIGYGVAALIVVAQVLTGTSQCAVRGGVAVFTWVMTALVPLIVFAVERSAGRTDRAQEEVLVIEAGGHRLWTTGTPYLDRADIAALPPDERLFGYLPYQPGMAAFGTPRQVDPAAAWWSDDRVWFALVAIAALGAGLFLLRRAGAPATALVRAMQAATVLPICALTLVTSGNDLPVLGLCLLALALAATGRCGWAGLAIGAAASLKLFAWPVLVVLGVYAVIHGAGRRYLAGALGLPLLTALPALVVNPSALVENVFAFPLGRGLVTSPAASPLPGYLIATYVPGGRVLALVLLAALAVGFAVLLVRRPPRTIGAVAVLSGLGLLGAMLLLTSTRFGYLLYPAALLVWAPALAVVREAGRDPDA